MNEIQNKKSINQEEQLKNIELILNNLNLYNCNKYINSNNNNEYELKQLKQENYNLKKELSKYCNYCNICNKWINKHKMKEHYNNNDHDDIYC
tara:strand:+ start:382 stop:660 length:279 start_codon:yes stop_codon:yes gene_type:complete